MNQGFGFYQPYKKLDGTIPNNKQDYYLEIVSTEIRRLSRLVVSMLNMSKIESGDLEMKPSNYDITDLNIRIVLGKLNFNITAVVGKLNGIVKQIVNCLINHIRVSNNIYEFDNNEERLEPHITEENEKEAVNNTSDSTEGNTTYHYAYKNHPWLLFSEHPPDPVSEPERRSLDWI